MVGLALYARVTGLKPPSGKGVSSCSTGSSPCPVLIVGGATIPGGHHEIEAETSVVHWVSGLTLAPGGSCRPPDGLWRRAEAVGAAPAARPAPSAEPGDETRQRPRGGLGGASLGNGGEGSRASP